MRILGELKERLINGNIFWEYMGELYPDYLAHGDAKSFIEHRALRYCKGYGLDIGCGKWPLPNVFMIDNEEIENAYKLNWDDKSLDFIFSSHCFEHLDRPNEALAHWITKIKPGGNIFLYLPHPDMKIWSPEGPHGKKHKWIPTPEGLAKMFTEQNLTIIDVSVCRDAYWSFYICGQK